MSSPESIPLRIGESVLSIGKYLLIFFLSICGSPFETFGESRSFAFWRGGNVIDESTGQTEKVKLIIKKLFDNTETILHTFNRSEMLADAGVTSASAQLTFGRIQASADGSEIIIGYGVKAEAGDNMKLAKIEKLNLKNGSRVTIREWSATSPAGSFNYDFSPLTVDWSNQKIYFFETDDNKSIDTLVSLSFNGGDAQVIKDIPGSPETVQLSPLDQNVMVMAEDENELGVLYVFNKDGVEQSPFKTSNEPNDHMFSFSASGNDILYLYAPEIGNPLIKSMSKSGGIESTRFDYAKLNPGSWNPFASDGDFKDVESFFNENGGRIAFVAESSSRDYPSELVELDLNSGLTTILTTGKANLPSVADAFEEGWIFSYSGAPVAQTVPSGGSSTPPSNDPVVPTEPVPVPTTTPPQPSAWITGANPVAGGGDWQLSDWFGYFWEKPNSAWIYHPAIGWLYLVSNPDSSLWAYTQDLYSTPLWLWIKPDIFPFVYAKAAGSRNRRVGETETVTTTWYNKVLSNKYIEWEMKNATFATPPADYGPGTTFNAVSGDDDSPLPFGLMVDYFEYLKGFDSQHGEGEITKYLAYFGDQSKEVTENNEQYEFVGSHYFLTGSGHQGYIVHITAKIQNMISNQYWFQIDGSTVGFPQPENTWLRVAFVLAGMDDFSIEDAKAIADGLKFKGGTPKPAIELPQFAGVTPGSIVSESNLPPSSNSVVSETIETTWSNKILSNKYVEWNLGDEWVGYIVKEFPLTGRWNQSNLVFGANKKSNSRVGFVFDLLYEEPINFAGNDNFFEVSQLPLTGAEEILAKETFLTDDGHQAVVVHSQISPPVNNMQSFTFLVDGSTVGFPQPEGTWMKARIGIVTNAPTDGSEPLEILSMADAKAIVNGLKFKGGAPNPALELPQFAGMSSGSSAGESNPITPGSENPSITPSTSPTTPAVPTAPDFEGGVWLYLDMENGNFTDWNDQSNTWGEWSKIEKLKPTVYSTTSSVTEKHQGIDFPTAVDSIMNSSMSEEDKKKELGDYILGL